VERTHAWMNGYGKLHRCTGRNAKVVDFYLYLAAALVTIRQLIQRARALPLGHPPDHQAAQVTPIARHSKPGMPSSGVAGLRSEAMVLRLARRSSEVMHGRGWAFIAARTPAARDLRLWWMPEGKPSWDIEQIRGGVRPAEAGDASPVVAARRPLL
jgi:hypothetical protein